MVSHVLSRGIGLWRGGHWTGRVGWRNFVEGGGGGAFWSHVEKRAVQGGGGDQGPVLCRGH